ncbi:hypothetical protein FRC03_000306 [Tulasnella sp. 419]|nr:hypothetical protein FRC03_000306 [Tulasnella sp. 419]
MSSPADANDAILVQNRLSSPSNVDLEKGLTNNEAQIEIKPISSSVAAGSPGSPLSKPLPLSVMIPMSPIIELGSEQPLPMELPDVKPPSPTSRPGTLSTHYMRAQPQQPPAASTIQYGPAPKPGADGPPDPQSDIPVTIDQYIPFWKAYNDDADAQDHEIVESLGSDLDALLIFAGLFSASNVAFIVEAYKELRRDNVDTTNDLLRIIIHNQIDPNQPVTDNKRVFKVDGRAIRINALFFASLSCSLFTAFGAVLGKQWLNHYKREGKRMTLAERGRERQKKYIGLAFWHLEQVVETLPTLLQLSLFLFLGALVDFIWPLNEATASVIAALSIVTFGFYVITTTIAALYPSAPFQTRFTAVIRDAGHMTLIQSKLAMAWLKLAWSSTSSKGRAAWSEVLLFFRAQVFTRVTANLPEPLHSLPDLFTSSLSQTRLFIHRLATGGAAIITLIRTKLREAYDRVRSIVRTPSLGTPDMNVDETSENEKKGVAPEAINDAAQGALQRSPHSPVASIPSESRPKETKQDDPRRSFKNIIQDLLKTVHGRIISGFTLLRSLFVRSSPEQVQESSEELSQHALSRECITWLLTTSSVDQTRSLAATAALMLPESIWTKVEGLQRDSDVLGLVLRARAFESKVFVFVPTDILRSVLEPIHALVKRWDRANDFVLPTLMNNDAFITAFELILWKVVKAYPRDAKAAICIMGILDMFGFTVEPRQRDIDIIYQCVIETVTPQKYLQPVLGSAILLEDSMNLVSLRDLLRLPPEVDVYDIAEILRPFHGSVLVVEENKFIRLVHHSAQSFFTDINRCRDTRFMIDPTICHTNLTLQCLNRMTESLRRNMLGRENPVEVNSDITDLPSLLEAAGVAETVKYACRHWATHLQFASPRSQKLNDAIKRFFETTVLPWLEVMSLLGHYDEALTSLQRADVWMQNRDQSDAVATLLRDTGRLATTYRNMISNGASTIYSIALQLAYPSRLHDIYETDSPSLKVSFLDQANFWEFVFRIISPGAGEVNGIYAAHDSKHVVIGLDDYTARLFALGSGSCITTYEGHSNYVMGVALSPNNRLLASGGYDRTMRIWDTKTGFMKSILEGHTYIVYAVSFSPDSRFIVSSGGDRSIRLWDAKDGSHIVTIEGHTDYVRSAKFSPDSRMILSASDDNTIRLWDVVDYSPIAILHGHTNYVVSAVFSPNGALIASGGFDHTVRIWDVKSRSLLHTLKGHSEYVYCVAFSSDGKYVASSSDDYTVRVWDALDGSIQRVLEGHGDPVRAVTFTPDNKYVVSGSADATMRVWNWLGKDGKPIKSRPFHSDRISLIEFSPNGQVVASAGNRGEVHLWDAIKLTHITKLVGLSESIDSPSSLAFSSDSKYVTLSSWERSINWDLSTYEMVKEVVPSAPKSDASLQDPTQETVEHETGEEVAVPAVQYMVGLEYRTVYAYRVTSDGRRTEKVVCHSPVANVSASSGRGYQLALGTTGGHVMMLDFSSLISFESLYPSEG